MSDERVRERLTRHAWLLDSSIPIPGTGLSIGIDALIGLFPVLGDLIGVALSGYLITEAHRLGASRAVLARMAFNVAAEGVVGMVPVPGDGFHAAWKANPPKLRRVAASTSPPPKHDRGS